LKKCSKVFIWDINSDVIKCSAYVIDNKVWFSEGGLEKGQNH